MTIIKDKHMHILLTEDQHKKLKAYAKKTGKSVGQIIRDIIEKIEK